MAWKYVHNILLNEKSKLQYHPIFKKFNVIHTVFPGYYDSLFFLLPTISEVRMSLIVTMNI